MKKIALFGLLLVTIAACKKIDPKSPNTDIINGIDSSKLLISMQQFYNPATKQLTGVNTYFYDVKNRLIKEVDSTAGGPPSIILYKYDNNTNNLNYVYYQGTPFTFTYKDNKPDMLYRDNPAAGYRDTAQYYVTDSKMRSLTYSFYDRILNCYYTGDNLTRVRTKDLYEFIGDTSSVYFAYGTHKSPFYLSGLQYHYTEQLPTGEIRGSNELVEQYYSNRDNHSDTTKYTYTYNKYGYPVTGKMYFRGVDSQHIHYFYTLVK